VYFVQLDLVCLWVHSPTVTRSCQLMLVFFNKTTLCFLSETDWLSIDNNSFDLLVILCTSFQSEYLFIVFYENKSSTVFGKMPIAFNISRSNSASLSSFQARLFVPVQGFQLAITWKLPCPNSSYSLRHLYN
jgi:hypothetical protein